MVKTNSQSPSCLKTVRIMLETLNLVLKHTSIFSFIKYTFWYQGLLIFLMSTFFAKDLHFFWQNRTFIQRNSLKTELRFFSSVFSFCKQKVTINDNVSFKDYASGIQHLDCFPLTINWKYDNDATILRHNAIVNFF